MLLLADKIVLVVGASRGIGLAIAAACAQQGAHVVLASRAMPSLEAAAQSIRNQCPAARVDMLVCDVASPQSVKQAFMALQKISKTLDALVVCAGVMENRLLGMADGEHVRRTFETNVFGGIYLSQYASRMMARRHSGSIVFLSSVVGLHGAAGQSVYAASKAALLGLTQSLSKEFAPDGVRVNALAPGFIETDMTRDLPAELVSRTVAAIGLGRPGQAEDVAKAALFLVSDLSGYVTGQVLAVDGGLTL